MRQPEFLNVPRTRISSALLCCLTWTSGRHVCVRTDLSFRRRALLQSVPAIKMYFRSRLSGSHSGTIGIPHDPADRAGREAARDGGRRRGGAIASALDSFFAIAGPRAALRAQIAPAAFPDVLGHALALRRTRRFSIESMGKPEGLVSSNRMTVALTFSFTSQHCETATKSPKAKL